MYVSITYYMLNEFLPLSDRIGMGIISTAEDDPRESDPEMKKRSDMMSQSVPREVVSVYNKALALSSRGDYTKALGEYERAISMHPCFHTGL